MVADSALKRIGIKGNRKEKVELYFDVAGVMQLVSGDSDAGANPMSGLSDQLQDQIDSFIKDFLPTTPQIIEFLRSQFNLDISDDNKLTLNIADLVTDLTNSTVFDTAFPTFNLSNLLPFLNFSNTALIDIPLSNVSGLSLRDIINNQSISFDLSNAT